MDTAASVGIQWSSVIIGFLVGILATVISDRIGLSFREKIDEKKYRAKVLFNIYMKLIELKSCYWMLHMAEIHNESRNLKKANDAYNLKWIILDEIRTVKNIPYMYEILDVIHSNRFATVKEKYEAIVKLVDKVGHKVNPIFDELMSKIEKNDLSRLQE